jgi:hypothetical protein
VPTIPISPMPFAPSGLKYRSSWSSVYASMEPTSAFVCDVVAGEVLIDDVSEAGVHDAVFEQRHRESHGHASDELRAGGLRVDDPPGVEHPKQARHTHFTSLLAHTHLGKLRTELYIDRCLVYGLAGMSAVTSTPCSGTFP